MSSSKLTAGMLVLCVLLGVAIAVPNGWPVAIAAACGVLLVAGMLSAPSAVLLSFVATRPLADAFVRVSVGPLSLGQVWSVVLIVSVLVCLACLPRADTRRPWYDVVPYAFVGAYALLTLWRPDALVAVGNTLKILAWVLLIEATSRIVVSDKDVGRALTAGRALGFVAISGVLLAMARGEYGLGYYYSSARFTDFLMSGPHGLAALCVLSMAFPLIAITMHRESRVDVPLTCVLAACALLSLTRTSMLALTVVALGVIVAGVWGRRTSLVTAVIAAAIGVGAIVYFVGDRMISRVIGGGGAFWASQLAPTGGSGRIGIWEALQTRFLADLAGLVIGYGAASTTQISRETLGIALLAHNDILELLTTGGLGLLILYLAALAWMWFQLGLDERGRGATVTVARSILFGYAVFSVFNGIVFSQASVALALFVGLLRGQRLLDDLTGRAEVAS